MIPPDDDSGSASARGGFFGFDVERPARFLVAALAVVGLLAVALVGDVGRGETVRTAAAARGGAGGFVDTTSGSVRGFELDLLGAGFSRGLGGQIPIARRDAAGGTATGTTMGAARLSRNKSRCV